MRRFFMIMAAAVAVGAAGCGEQAAGNEDRGGEPGTAGGTAAPAAETTAATGLIPNTPAGGIEQWIADIRTGLEVVPAQVAEDPALAQKTALDLYVSRQEYLELYYGENGRYRASEALAQAIAADEAAFHRILELVNPAASPRSTSEDVRAALDTLNVRLDEVLEEARAAGVDLTKPVAPAANR